MYRKYFFRKKISNFLSSFNSIFVLRRLKTFEGPPSTKKHDDSVIRGELNTRVMRSDKTQTVFVASSLDRIFARKKRSTWVNFLLSRPPNTFVNPFLPFTSFPSFRIIRTREKNHSFTEKVPSPSDALSFDESANFEFTDCNARV